MGLCESSTRPSKYILQAKLNQNKLLQHKFPFTLVSDNNSNVLLPISQGIRTAGHHILHTPQEEQPGDLPPRLPPCCNGIRDVDSIEV